MAVTPYLTQPVRTMQALQRDRFLPWFILACLVHVPLALLLGNDDQLATIHALAVLGLGAWFILRDRVPTRLVYLLGYIVGADVLWRMMDAGVFWEYGKYAATLLMIMAIIRWRMHFYPAPIVYFALLVPSVVLTFSSTSLWDAREQISFNLSGQLALAVALLFFMNLRMNRKQVMHALLWVLPPVISIATWVLFRIQTAGSITFFTESNFQTSGGFGPNQTSAILGLGALICLVYLLAANVSILPRLVFALLGMWLLSQAVITFSRGGVLNFAIAGVISSFFLATGAPRLRGALVVLVVLASIFAYVVLPRLEAFSGGQLSARYQELDSAGRDILFREDIQVWQNNLFAGAGPGQSTQAHVLAGFDNLAAHTEYSRLLAEHGLFGVAVLILLAAFGIRAFFKAKSQFARGIVLALMLWSLIEMGHAAMRIVAISYLYALPSMTIED